MMNRIHRHSRIKKRNDFRRVFDEGAYYANALLSVHVYANAGQRRAGFSAGKKLGCAVIRNRCKRRLRECFRLNQAALPEGVDMVIVARRAMIRASWSKLVRSFLEATQRSWYNLQKKRSESP